MYISVQLFYLGNYLIIQNVNWQRVWNVFPSFDQFFRSFDSVSSEWHLSRPWQTQQNDSAPCEDSDQPGHRPSLIWVFTVRFMGSQEPRLSSCGQRRLWSDWANAQADLSVRWVHMPFCWFCHEAVHFMLTVSLPFRFYDKGLVSDIRKGNKISIMSISGLSIHFLKTRYLFDSIFREHMHSCKILHVMTFTG